MPSLDISLTHLDAFRFLAFPNVETAFAALRITTREHVAERLRIPLAGVPDMSELVGAITNEIRCNGIPTATGVQCDDEAATFSVMGCLHEHIVTAPLCATHLHQSLRMESMWCGLCADHSCNFVEITFGRGRHVETWLTNTLTVGVTTTDTEELGRIREFVAANLGRIVPAHLLEGSRD